MTSKKPDINKRILPIKTVLNQIPFCMELNPKIIEEMIAITKPNTVIEFGDIPSSAKIDPILSRIGCRFFLNLFSNNYLTSDINYIRFIFFEIFLKLSLILESY